MWEIIGVITAAIVAIIGTMSFFEAKRDKKIEKNRKTWKERDQILKGEIIKEVDEKLEGYVCKSEYYGERDSLKNKLDSIDQQLKIHFDESLKTELFRLSSEIIAFAEDLKSGLEKSSVAYLHVCESYERYKKLGGNSYVGEVFEYIKAKMKQ